MNGARLLLIRPDSNEVLIWDSVKQMFVPYTEIALDLGAALAASRELESQAKPRARGAANRLGGF
jgi:hypothetical protein